MAVGFPVLRSFTLVLGVQFATHSSPSWNCGTVPHSRCFADAFSSEKPHDGDFTGWDRRRGAGQLHQRPQVPPSTLRVTGFEFLHPVLGVDHQRLPGLQFRERQVGRAGFAVVDELQNTGPVNVNFGQPATLRAWVKSHRPDALVAPVGFRHSGVVSSAALAIG